MLSAAIPDGILLVDKAEGMTSHDVVALARRQLGIKKIGHCGTLDPIATGLLLLTIGRIALPEIDFSVLCSKGFYVRTYAHDIGQLLGCGAHLKSLRRTQSGRFDVGNAISVEQIKELPREKIAQRILSLPQVSRMRGA